MVAQIANSIAALFGALAAILWYRSSKVRTPETFSILVDITPATWDGSVGGKGYSPDLQALGTALSSQSRLSKNAAICAAVAAICQAVGLFAAL